MKRQIPNLITLGNLLCGFIATLIAASSDEPRALAIAALFICLGIFLDFFDGLTARLLGVVSPLGKELDSLADVVTSGVAPAALLFGILDSAVLYDGVPSWMDWLPFTAFLMPLFAAYRLAKFNLDTRQHHSFVGLPVPANALIWVGIALWYGTHSNVEFGQTLGPYMGPIAIITLTLLTLIVDILMVSELPMFSLKFDFKDLSWKSNAVPYCFLIGCVVIIVATRTWYSVSIIIAWYILLSLISCKKRHVQ